MNRNFQDQNLYNNFYAPPWKGKNIFMAPLLLTKIFRSPPFTP